METYAVLGIKFNKEGYKTYFTLVEDKDTNDPYEFIKRLKDNAEFIISQHPYADTYCLESVLAYNTFDNLIKKKIKDILVFRGLSLVDAFHIVLFGRNVARLYDKSMESLVIDEFPINNMYLEDIKGSHLEDITRFLDVKREGFDLNTYKKFANFVRSDTDTQMKKTEKRTDLTIKLIRSYFSNRNGDMIQ